MKGKTILIIDADTEFVRELTAALVAEQYTVCTAGDVLVGVSRFKSENPDLTIAAFRCPGGGVTQLSRMVHRHNGTLPIIALVDENAPDQRAQAREVDLAEVFTKPVDTNELLAAIDGLFTNPEERALAVSKRPYRTALIIDDEVDHCEMIRDCFARSGREEIRMTFAHTVADACARISEDRYDFILLDHNLPDGTGVDVLEQMETELLTTPVIGLSTSGDPNVALADFRGGALEFIEKHEAFEGEKLRRRVFEVIANFKRRITASTVERRRHESGLDECDERLIAAARTDTLMQIFNRATFNDAHAELHRQSLEHGRNYGLCLLDVDNFKKFNDRYGHAAGDAALRTVAQALASILRPEDFIARFGGEEIVVLIDGISAEDVEAPARQMCEIVSALNLPHADNEGFGVVTVSVGAATFDPQSGETELQLIERADKALYAAKAAGRNTHEVASGRRKAA